MFDKVNIKDVMAYSLGFSLALQRLSMALGSIFFTISILCFVYLFVASYRQGTLKEYVGNYRKYYKIVVFMLICFLPSIITSGNVQQSFGIFIKMWIYRAMPFFMITLFLCERKYIISIAIFVLSSLNLDCLYAVYQSVALHMTRANGISEHPLNLTHWLCLMIPCLTVYSLEPKFKGKLQNFARLSLIVCLFGLLAGQGRSGWLSVAFTVPIISIYYIVKSKKALAVSLVILVGLGAFFATNVKFQKRLISSVNVTTDVSNVDRVRVWKSALEMIKDYPLTGVGNGQFGKVYNSGYRLKETVQDLPHAHCNLLQTAVENGIIGLIGFVGFMGFMLINQFKIWFYTKSAYAIMLLGSLLCWNLFGLVDWPLNHTTIMRVFWFLIGALLVMQHIEAVEKVYKNI